jgi:hypothetical protein
MYVYTPHGVTACGENSANNYAPYLAECRSCQSSKFMLMERDGTPMMVAHLLSGAQSVNPVQTDTACLALCNTNKYHSYDMGSKDFTNGVPIPVGRLNCKPCGEDLTIPCGNRCADGQFFTANTTVGKGACTQCTTVPCGAELYREQCLSGVSTVDARCLPRSSEALGNSGDYNLHGDYHDGALAAAAADTAGYRVNRPRRRWLTGTELQASPGAPYVVACASPHVDQCALACVNNHAWINLTTGRSPFTGSRLVVRDAPELFCLPCRSRFIAHGGNDRLYSVWNAVNVTEDGAPSGEAAGPGSALESMAGLPGGCYHCTGFARDVVATSVRMCELKAGYSGQTADAGGLDGLAFVDLTITMMLPLINASSAEGEGVGGPLLLETGESSIVPSIPTGLWAPPPEQYGAGRRRLLATASAAALVADRIDALGEAGLIASVHALMLNPPPPVAAVRITTQRVRAARPPILAHGDRYTCCDSEGGDPVSAGQCYALQGAARYYGLNARIGAQVRAPCQMAAVVSQPRQQRRLQQQQPVDDGGRAWFTTGSGEPPTEACPVGTFKPERGDAPCAACPVGASTMTMAGTNAVAATLPEHCACQAGYYAERAAAAVTDPQLATGPNASQLLGRRLKVCRPCPSGTFRGLLQTTNDTVCQACPPLKYTLGVGASDCLCVPGAYESAAVYGAGVCVECEAHHYCTGGVRTACPQHSFAPAGAASRAACVCDPSGFYGALGIPDSICYPLTSFPGMGCRGASPSNDAVTVNGCGCASGWRSVPITLASGALFLQCVSPCAAGQYAQLTPFSADLSACVACPADTYAGDGTLVSACTPCPVGRGTRGRTGQTSAANCTCVVGVARNASGGGSDCTGCAAGLFFDLLTKQCMPCPTGGWTSAANTIGGVHCKCPPGAYATGSTCSPCPVGSYSRTLGLHCTPCPSGCTTDAVGQTSLAACRCVHALL